MSTTKPTVQLGLYMFCTSPSALHLQLHKLILKFQKFQLIFFKCKHLTETEHLKQFRIFLFFLPYSPQKCVATEKSHLVCFDVNVLTSSLLTLAHQVRSCCKESTTPWKALHVLCFAARKPPASLASLMLPITLNNSGFLRSRSVIRNRHPNLTSLINNIIPFLLRLPFFTPPSIYEFHESC